MKLNNPDKKIALVTGAASGIGLEIVKALLAKGVEVIGVGAKEPCDINSESIKF